MEKLLLKVLLAFDELDVVDEQQVVGAVAELERVGLFVPQSVDKLVHHRLGRDVPHTQPGMLLEDIVTNRLKQVRFPQAGAPVDEERVVRLGG